MKALVATRLTQGARRSDYTKCVDGELVWMIDPCEYSRAKIDGRCVCGRSFSGMNSHGYTTTAIVRELAGFTREDFEAALRASFTAQGWCSCCLAEPLVDHADKLLGLAAQWPVGAVVERRLDEVKLRRVLPVRGGDAKKL